MSENIKSKTQPDNSDKIRVDSDIDENALANLVGFFDVLIQIDLTTKSNQKVSEVSEE